MDGGDSITMIEMGGGGGSKKRGCLNFFSYSLLGAYSFFNVRKC